MTAEPVGDRHHRVEDRPARPRNLRAAADPRRSQPQRLLERGDAALAEADLVAHPARIRGEAVDVVGGQTGVGDRREAGVDGERQRIAHQPAADVGSADPRDDRLVLVAVVGEREPHGRPCRFDDPVDRIGLAGQLEQRDPHVPSSIMVACSNSTRTSRAELHLVGLAVDDVRREVDRRVVGERDVGDHVRRGEVGQPLLVVDRQSDDRGEPRHHPRRRRRTATRRADRRRWVDEFVALVAALDAQLAVLTRGPEPAVPRQQPGQRPLGHWTVRARMRARERQRVSGQPRPAWPGNAVISTGR